MRSKQKLKYSQSFFYNKMYWMSDLIGPLKDSINRKCSTESDQKISERNSLLDRQGSVFLEKGLQLLKEESFEPSIRNFTQAISIYSQIDNTQDELSTLHYLRGLAYTKKFELSQAIKDYTFSIKYNGENHLAFFNRGLTYMKLNNKNDALKDLKKAKELGNSEVTVIIKNHFANKSKSLLQKKA